MDEDISPSGTTEGSIPGRKERTGNVSVSRGQYQGIEIVAVAVAVGIFVFQGIENGTKSGGILNGINTAFLVCRVEKLEGEGLWGINFVNGCGSADFVGDRK